MADFARLTIVPNEVEAELVCSFLREAGIRCAHRITNVGAGASDGLPSAAGPREVLVDPGDLDEARRALAAAELGEFLP